MRLLLTLLAEGSFVHAWIAFTSVVYNNTVYPEFQYIRKWHNDTQPFFWTPSVFAPVFAQKTTPDGGALNTLSIRCNSNAVPANSTLEVLAGTNIGFQMSSDGYANGRGPTTAWMAKVPKGEKAESWDGDGLVWFKIFEDQPIWEHRSDWPTGKPQYFYSWPLWPYNRINPVVFTIPAAVPNGEYLFRVEQIYYDPEPYGPILTGDAFFVACAQIRIAGGGGGTPGPLAEFPGTYKISDPILQDVDKWAGYTNETYTSAPWFNHTLGQLVWSG